MKHDELSAIGEAMAAIRTAPPEQRARHAQFSDLRLIGEWFDYAEPLRAHVAALAS